MPTRTNIGWSDYSSNPVRARRAGANSIGEFVPVQGWACVRASAGCLNCYAASMNKRLGTGLDYVAPNMERVETYLDERELQRMLRFRPKGPFKNGRTRPTVFVGDMTDLFGEWVADEMLDRLFAVMALRPDVDFLLLTKRPERMRAYMTQLNIQRVLQAQIRADIEANGCTNDVLWRGFTNLLTVPQQDYIRARCVARRESWLRIVARSPVDYLEESVTLPNVGLGVSVENQATADERTPELLATPAAWRFISAEPLLGPLSFGWDDWGYVERPDWVVVGAESGPKRRRCEVEWIESIVRQCDAAGVSCFVKQDSALRPGQQGRIPDDLWARKEVPG